MCVAACASRDTSDSKSRALIDETLAYVATSRPRYDAQIFTDNEEQLATALSRSHEKDIDESKPLLNARPPDGSRVTVAFPPCSRHGVTLTIPEVPVPLVHAARAGGGGRASRLRC